MEDIEITSLGVKRSLNKFTEIESVMEYIWNGFDAKANKIIITAKLNDLGSIESLKIKDNGEGINKNKIKEKFKPFFQSEKIAQQIQDKRKKNSTYHGKNGVGRLTFFKFSQTALWETVFEDLDGKNKKYTIEINSDNLTKYTPTDSVETEESCGTTVIFDSIFVPLSLEELIEEIKTEFCWYLVLNKESKYNIVINDIEIDFTDMILEKNSGKEMLNDFCFDWLFINWRTPLKKEYSKYYFINSQGKESFKEYTTFNNKGDKFYHSLFVKSEFFDYFILNKTDLNSPQMSIFQQQNYTYKKLLILLDKIISDRRIPYIKMYSNKVIEDLDKINAFDYYNTNDMVESFKKNNLQDFIRELYVIEPKIFAQLNKEQKLTMVRLLDATMNSLDRDNLFVILDSVLELDSDEKEQLSLILATTSLTSITKTINFLKERLKALDYFEQMVYNKSLNANEVNDLQYMLEQNYWLFGEQYSAVAKAEDNFVALVKNHFDILRKGDGEENQEALQEINSNPDKMKQVDLCCVRQMPCSDKIENIVVEIKHPLKKLTQTHYQQLRKYMEVLTSVKEFVADNYKWTFYLVGTSIDQSLQDDINNLKIKGKSNLVFEKDNYKIEIFIRTWKSIFNDYKIKYNSIYSKLKLEESELIKEKDKQIIKDKQSLLNVN